jgi:hypothetical protein
MPTWSEDELLCVDPNRDNWHNSYLLHGGVPRKVFSKYQKQEEEFVETLLESKGARIANRYFSTGYGDIDSDISYSITHINPPMLDDGSDWDYFGKRNYSFASKKIFMKVGQYFDKTILNEAINIFNSGKGPAIYGPVTCGMRLEKMCLIILPIYGKTLEIRALEKKYDDKMLTANLNSSYPLKLPQNMEFLNNTFVEDKNLKPDVFYQPVSTNLESGDAFCVISVNDERNITTYHMIIVQITVAESHPIKVKGLSDIVSAYPEDIQNKITKKALVFLTANHGKLKSVQQYTTKRGGAYNGNLPKEIKGIRQYKAEYNFPLVE